MKKGIIWRQDYGEPWQNDSEKLKKINQKIKKMVKQKMTIEKINDVVVVLHLRNVLKRPRKTNRPSDAESTYSFDIYFNGHIRSGNKKIKIHADNINSLKDEFIEKIIKKI